MVFTAALSRDGRLRLLRLAYVMMYKVSAILVRVRLDKGIAFIWQGGTAMTVEFRELLRSFAVQVPF